MKLHVSKMHGAGNDFVVIDGVSQPVTLSASQIRFIGDRKRGVGCDQILLAEPPDDPYADFRYTIYNADGSRAGQCGNGARCMARFLRKKGLTRRRKFTFQTDNEPLLISIEKDGRIFAGLPPPIFDPNLIPFEAPDNADEYPLEVQGQIVSVGAVSMGNPHAILIVDNCEEAPVTSLGGLIEKHERFPNRVNVNFMEILQRNEIRLRVFERGVGETQSCGSGACASAAHGIKLGILDSTVAVDLPGGKLSVSWEGIKEHVWLGGPTAFVFDATIFLKN